MVPIGERNFFSCKPLRRRFHFCFSLADRPIAPTKCFFPTKLLPLATLQRPHAKAGLPVENEHAYNMASISIRRGKLAPSTRKKPAGAYGASDTNWRVGVDPPSFGVSRRIKCG